MHACMHACMNRHHHTIKKAKSNHPYSRAGKIKMSGSRRTASEMNGGGRWLVGPPCLLTCTMTPVDNVLLASFVCWLVGWYIILGFFQGASSGRSEGGPRLNRLWTSSTPGAGKGLFRPHMHPAPIIYCLFESIISFDLDRNF